MLRVMRAIVIACIVVFATVASGFWWLASGTSQATGAAGATDSAIVMADPPGAAGQRQPSQGQVEVGQRVIGEGAAGANGYRNPLDTPLTAAAQANSVSAAAPTASKASPASSKATAAPSGQVSRAKFAYYNEPNRKAVLDALAQRTGTSPDDHSVHLQALYDCAGLYEKQRMNQANIPSDVAADASRKEAFVASNKRCEGVAKENLDWGHAQAELVKYERQGNPYALAMTLPHLTTVNRYDMISERLDQLLNLKDPVVMSPLRDFIIGQLDQPVFAQQLVADTHDLSALRNAWQAIECDYAGGCSPQSVTAANLCAQRGLCGDLNVSERLGQAYANNPNYERYRSALTNSYQTGNWDWLPLSLLRKAPPKP
jgi:hypothetical protein